MSLVVAVFAVLDLEKAFEERRAHFIIGIACLQYYRWTG
jgi:hypothetical protein